MRHQCPVALASGAARNCRERMPRWRVKEAVLLLSAFTLLACGDSREEAREKLGQMNIKYSDDTFLERVKDGDVVVVGHFLTAGMGLNVTDQEGKTPLIIAARAGRLEVVDLLLKRGADVNGKDKKFGATPLVWTALSDSGENKELITLLLSRGANVESREEKSGMTPVLSAAARGYEETVRLLLDKGAKVNDTDQEGRTPLMWAAQNGHASTVALFLEKGADLKVKEQKGGLDALIAASGRGRAGSVKLLLQKGADPRSVDKEGKTALMWAARNGNAETVQLLLDAGADVNARDGAGHTALAAAREGKKPAVEEMLLKAGAAPEKTTAGQNRK